MRSAPAADALLGRPLLDGGAPRRRRHARRRPADVGRGCRPSRPTTGLLTLRLPDEAGEWRYLEAGISDLRGDADVGAVVLHCRDMTERHAREQALQSVAYTDPMTGLPNRAGFLRPCGAVAAAADEPTTLLIVELDGLAAARENAGREIVSAVVAEIGRRLRATVRGEDVVARMGGGAFAVLAEGTDADADRLAARCLSVVEQPILTTAGHHRADLRRRARPAGGGSRRRRPPGARRPGRPGGARGRRRLRAAVPRRPR